MLDMSGLIRQLEDLYEPGEVVFQVYGDPRARGEKAARRYLGRSLVRTVKRV